MSLSYIENKEVDKRPYIKLIIYESQICENINVPMPYGLSISFNNNTKQFIEKINSDNEILKPPENTFIYYLDKIDFNNQNLEFVITSYTTSIFFLKKNFASSKIQIQSNNLNNIEKTCFFLKDINNNICIKLLISIEINIPNEKKKENKIKTINNNILCNNNKIIYENKIKNKSRSNTNHLINNPNTYLISTNYNSSRGNSLLNLTNNIYNINSNKNLNLSFPINLSPIMLIGKSNSFFIDSKNKQMENNMKIINNNLLYSKSLKSKEEKNPLTNDDDSLIINDNENDFELIEENDKDNDRKNIIEYNLNELINIKKNELDKKGFNKKNNDKYRQEIYDEINIYEKIYILNINNIYNENKIIEEKLVSKKQIRKNSNSNSNMDIITPRKAESYNKINLYERINKKTKKGILCLNKTIPHNQMYIKKLNLPNKNKNIKNYINSGRKLNNKKYTPINYKYKKFNRKLSTSASNISNNEKMNNDGNEKILKTEGKIKTKTKSINHESINMNKFKKIENKNIKRKSLKINGNIKLNYNDIINKKIIESSSNCQSKYSFSKINLSKEALTTKTNSTMTNTIINNKKKSNKYINKSIIMKSKTIENNIILPNRNESNYFHKNSNISLDKNIFAIENISPNDTNNRMGKTALNKINYDNNFAKKKLNLQDKTKIINNNKSLNIDNFKGFNSHNYFKGNPLFIKSNNNKKNLTIKNNTIRLNTNPNESNKKKNIKFRNSNLNISGNILLLNIQKPNKSTRENKRKPSSRKILLTELIK